MIGERISRKFTTASRLYLESVLIPLLHIEGRCHEVALTVQGNAEPSPVVVNISLRNHLGPRVYDVALFPASARRSFEEQLVGLRQDSERRASWLAQLEKLSGVGAWTYEVRTGRLLWSNRVYELYGVPHGAQVTLEMALEPLSVDVRQGIEAITKDPELCVDLAAMRMLPASPFDACDQAGVKVTAQSLVRYKTNDYSVPVAYGHQDVWVRGYVDEVVIGCRGEIIARHPRSWEREDVIFDPVHYLPLIEQKINSLDQAAPLQGWDLPEEFATLRRLMEGRMAKHGRREYVQVLRLLESFDLADLHAAVKQALQLGAIGFDAVKHLILCRVERRPPRLDLSIYPYLPRATVEKTSAKAYMRLLSSDAGEAA